MKNSNLFVIDLLKINCYRTETWLMKNVNHNKIMFCKKINPYFTSYQAVQLYCPENIIPYTHKHLLGIHHSKFTRNT